MPAGYGTSKWRQPGRPPTVPGVGRLVVRSPSASPAVNTTMATSPLPTSTAKRIHRKPVLGGLINEYARAA